jgi:hypothetical protein
MHIESPHPHAHTPHSTLHTPILLLPPQSLNRVIAWEPVPLFRAFIHYNLQLNNVSHLVELRAKIAGPEDGLKLNMEVCKK